LRVREERPPLPRSSGVRQALYTGKVGPSKSTLVFLRGEGRGRRASVQKKEAFFRVGERRKTRGDSPRREEKKKNGRVTFRERGKEREGDEKPVKKKVDFSCGENGTGKMVPYVILYRGREKKEISKPPSG